MKGNRAGKEFWSSEGKGTEWRARSLPRCFESVPQDGMTDGKRNVSDDEDAERRESFLCTIAPRRDASNDEKKRTNACADSLPGDFAKEG